MATYFNLCRSLDIFKIFWLNSVYWKYQEAHDSSRLNFNIAFLTVYSQQKELLPTLAPFRLKDSFDSWVSSSKEKVFFAHELQGFNIRPPLKDKNASILKPCMFIVVHKVAGNCGSCYVIFLLSLVWKLVYFLNRRSIWSNLLHFSKCLSPQKEENFCECLTLGGQNTHPRAISSVEKALQISAMVGADTTALKEPTSLQFIFGMCDHFDLSWLKT